MIYTVFAVLLLIFLIWLTIRHNNLPPKTAFIGNLMLVLIGGALYALVFGYLSFCLSAEGMDALFVEWAWNALKTYMEISVYPLVVFLFLTCFAALSSRLDKKFRTKNARITRFSTSLCCSAAMLLIAPFYSFMTANEQIPLDACILVLGIADALLLRCMFLIEKHVGEKK